MKHTSEGPGNRRLYFFNVLFKKLRSSFSKMISALVGISAGELRERDFSFQWPPFTTRGHKKSICRFQGRGEKIVWTCLTQDSIRPTVVNLNKKTHTSNNSQWMREVQRGTESRPTVRDTQTKSTASTFIYTIRTHTSGPNRRETKQRSQQLMSVRRFPPGLWRDSFHSRFIARQFGYFAEYDKHGGQKPDETTSSSECKRLGTQIEVHSCDGAMRGGWKRGDSRVGRWFDSCSRTGGEKCHLKRFSAKISETVPPLFSMNMCTPKEKLSQHACDAASQHRNSALLKNTRMCWM